MGGLVAAARARELGLEPVVLEKGDRAGGSMVLSSCVAWRHRSAEAFAAECPAGDRELQRLIVERLDEALVWLEGLGAPVVVPGTGNRRTVGRRFDPRGLTAALVRAAGEPRLGSPLRGDEELPLVLATGGCGGSLARRLGLPLRANPWSEGDGLRFALARAAATAGDLGEFYGRAMPRAPFGESDFVAAAQLYGRHAVVLDADERELDLDLTWSEVELPQALARNGGAGWLVVDGRALDEPVRERTVADLIAVAEALGAEVRRADRLEDLGFAAAPSARLAEPPFTAVAVTASVTHTLGGVRVDARARVLQADGTPVDGLYAAGVDAGGIASGGYASGLAQALVLGLVAAETAAS
jgi:succinate dehydrogenase/fumarate reductase flavoprotein subunit